MKFFLKEYTANLVENFSLDAVNSYGVRVPLRKVFSDIKPCYHFHLNLSKVEFDFMQENKENVFVFNQYEFNN